MKELRAVLRNGGQLLGLVTSRPEGWLHGFDSTNGNFPFACTTSAYEATLDPRLGAGDRSSEEGENTNQSEISSLSPTSGKKWGEKGGAEGLSRRDGCGTREEPAT
jgi:hypothetical protein